MTKATDCMYDKKKISVGEALKIRDQAKSSNGAKYTFTCVECGNPVRPHKAGGNNPAHFEHQTHDSECPRCQVYKK